MNVCVGFEPLCQANLGKLILPSNLPLVIAELVAVVISRNNVYKQDVFGFGIHPSQFHFVAWKHSPERNQEMC